MTSELSLSPALTIFQRDVIGERWRQLKRWGRQRHTDGTGHLSDRDLATMYRAICDYNAKEGTVTWRDILMEEVHEALAESEREPLRTELVQVIAVAFAWIEDLDNRAGDRAVLPGPVLADTVEKVTA